MTNIPVERWAKDHWSTLAYVGTLADGVPDHERMRCDPDVHPRRANSANRMARGQKYPTRLKDGEVVNHDDWSCLEDAEAAGFVKLVVSQSARDDIVTCLLTQEGRDVLARLAAFGKIGGTYKAFDPSMSVGAVQVFEGSGETRYVVRIWPFADENLEPKANDLWFCGSPIVDAEGWVRDARRGKRAEAVQVTQAEIDALMASKSYTGYRYKAEEVL
jgi:hypothetical protein